LLQELKYLFFLFVSMALEQQKCHLVPIDFQDEDQLTTLGIQRKICGWDYERSVFAGWDKATKEEPYGSPNCQWITLGTFMGRFVFKDGDDKEEHNYWEEPRADKENITYNIPWYLRMGYEIFRSEPRYPYKLKDGTDIICVAAFLRKPASSIVI
jgi:hypothetical protein